MNNFTDFHTVKDLRLDTKKLQEALLQVLKIKKYDDANGVKNFAAVCLNQVPGKPESTKGNYARGVYWTKPDDTGKEVKRDKPIDEAIDCGNAVAAYKLLGYGARHLPNVKELEEFILNQKKKLE